jgi:penicillin-binding protein 1A
MANLGITPPQRKKKRRKSTALRLFGFLFTAGVFVFLAGTATAAYYLWVVSKDLPDYEGLARWEPSVVTRVHADDGSLIAEYARERRIYVPISAIPQKVINGFIAAEDKNFYRHNGVDPEGVLRALYTDIVNKLHGHKGPLQGASTITQQVAKNFLLSREQRITRKVKELILAIRIERAFTKDKILELYLNAINLGKGSYGVAAAALNYFGKELRDLKTEEIAYLAILPKAPNHYDPFRHTAKALARRNYVLRRMAADGYITEAEAEAARKKPLKVNLRPFGVQLRAGEFFAEEARRTLLDLYDDKKLYEGGLSVHATLDPQLQQAARTALREGLVRFDRARGWRGPVKTIDPSGDWGARLAKISTYSDLEPWRLGVVLNATKDEAKIGLQPKLRVSGRVDPKRTVITVGLEEVKWARKGLSKRTATNIRLGPRVKAVTDVLARGDVVYVAPKVPLLDEKKRADRRRSPKSDPEEAADDGQVTWRLMQIPKIEGAIAVMDPHTGRVLAVVGGFSFSASQFDRAVQAKRQPGSSFKPIVYAAALDNGYTPSSIVVDGPLAIEQGPNKELWNVKNYSGKFYGPSTLRIGVEQSRNLMTVRLAQDLGMPLIAEYANRFRVYDDLPPLLSMSLGAGETTLLRMTTAYCMFVNGGKRVTATFIDRIQDRYGATIWTHDRRKCPKCEADEWRGQDEPELIDNRRQVIDPMTAYQITSILEGVVKRGTGTVVAKVGKPLAGKTGTTNEEKDAWFVGFSPDLVAGVFIGYDIPKPMGKGGTGGHLAAPVFRDFMKLALKDKPAVPFRIPSGVKLVRIDRKTGMRAQAGEKNVIMEAFKPYDEPPDPFSSVSSSDGRDPDYEDRGGYGNSPRDPYGESSPPRGADGSPYDGQSYGRQPQAGGLY